MSDLVERLRENIIADAYERRAIRISEYPLAERIALERKEAAARIERLEAALKKIAKVTYGSDWTWGSEELADYYSMRFFNAQETARAALGEEKK